MLTTITSNQRALRFTTTFAATILITVILLFCAGTDTVDAGVNAHQRGFDVGSKHNKPEGVWSDGHTMWILDDRDDKSELIAYRLSTGARLPDKDIDLSSNNSKPQGITSDGTIMWVADWDDKKLFAYDIESQSRVTDRDIRLGPGNLAPRGIAAGSDYMFVVDSTKKKVFLYRLSNGEELTNKSFALHDGNDHPWGVWVSTRSDSKEVWVTDHRDDIAYRYDYSQKTGDPAFRLPIGSGDPKGIWSDEKLFWIVDDDDDHVYAVVYDGFRLQDADVSITGATQPAGLWTDGTTMWVGNKGVVHETLLAYNLSDGSPTTPNYFLTDANEDPVAMWSDGVHIWVCDADDGLLYAYEMDAIGAHSQANLKTLDSDNAHPTGIWSDGTLMWVSDKSDDKLYAYEWPLMTRHETRDIPFHSANDDPGNIWSDGEHIWVFDRSRKNAFAYSLDDGVRQQSQDFRPAPQNDRFSGGMTGYRQRVWVVDPQDELIYAYAKLNRPASFVVDSVRFEMYHGLPGNGLVGQLPEATDADGDGLLFHLRGSDSSRFSIDLDLGIRSLDSATFSAGESLSFVATVHDGKGLIGRSDDSADDSVTVYVDVLHNADPEFIIPSVESFMVAEDASETDVVARIEVSDPDGDSLIYGIDDPSTHPFQVTDGNIMLKAGETLDYEATASYDLNVRVRDDKDVNDGVDTTWDDEISIPISVTNVDEAGTVTLGSNNPEVNVQLSASLNDPDGSVANLTWQWQKADTVDATTWTNISGATASSYTPASGDAGKFIRAEASYDDGESTGKEAVRAADNAVLADTPTNRSPSFTEGATATRSVREDARAGDFVGTPIVATDPDTGDTLDYRLLEWNSSFFTTTFTSGQIFLRSGAYPDYERRRSYTMTIQVRDKKDADGEDDIVWDAFIDVTVNVIDVDEPGTVSLTQEHPRVGQQISAELDDPDNLVSNVSWQWQTADTADATTWTDVTDATTADYTPTFADHGKFLRAQATYDDKHGTGKIVHGTSDNGVPRRAANQAPTFDAGATATRSVSEDAVTGARLGAAVLASDADNDKLTYSLATGDDAANFIVDASTGKLRVAAGALLDFETKPSLTVVVQVTDSQDSGHNSDSSIDDTITVTVDLINADEAGKVSLSIPRPKYGEAVTASLTDPDGGTTAISWQWAKSHDDGATWTDLASATSDTYTPVAADEGALLRATASYTDTQGSGKSASLMSSEAVRDPTVVDTSLESLLLDGISLEFHHRTFQYGASTPFADTRTTVTAIPSADSGVTVTISPADSAPSQDGHQVDLAVGNNPITVTVSHGDTAASTTYRVRVSREVQVQNVWEQDMNQGCSAGFAGITYIRCGSTSFVKTETRMDGYYTVNWRKWDRKKPAVTGYTVTLEQYMNKAYYLGNREVKMSSLRDVYENCEFSNGSWSCEKPVKRTYHEDSAGQPTERRVVLSDVDQTRLSWSLDSMEVTTTQETFHRWSGDATDPDNVPTAVTYQTKTSEVDRYHFVPHTGNGDVKTKKVTIDAMAFANPFAP